MLCFRFEANKFRKRADGRHSSKVISKTERRILGPRVVPELSSREMCIWQRSTMWGEEVRSARQRGHT